MADERIEAAIAHWAPRFTSQGVDMNDFQRVTKGARDVGRVAARVGGQRRHAHRARARGRGAGPHAQRRRGVGARGALVPLREVRLDGRHGRARPRRAARDLGDRERAPAPRPERGADRDPARRTRSRWPATCACRPASRAPPLVLLLPGLDSTKEEFFHWEQVFLDRGLATFSLDGPGQGEVSKTSHIWPNYEAAVTKAIDALEQRGFDNVGAAGVSLGGYYAPRAAAYEKRLRAVVGIGGPFTFGECWEQMPGPTRDTVMHHTGAADLEETRAKALELTLAEARR